MLCAYRKDSGEQCGAQAMLDSDYCFSHNPECRSQKLEAVRKGGLHKPVRDLESLPPLPVRTIHDVRVVIEDTVNRIRTEPMTHQKANSIGYLLNITISALEVAELEKRLEVLEKEYYEKS